MGTYYFLLLRKAGALWWARLHEWGPGVIWFILQTTFLFALIYWQPWLANPFDKGKEVGAAVAAVVASAIAMLFWDFIRAPALIDAEKSKLIEDQKTDLESLRGGAAPRLVIDPKFAQRTNDPVQYLVIRNPSATAALTDCLVRIESMVNEAGEEVLSYQPLRTENQTDERPGGRFNLDAMQPKRLPLVGAGSGSGNFRIVHAGGNPKFPNGNYRMTIHASTNMGGSPVKATVLIKGDRATLDTASDTPDAKPA